MFYIDKLVVQNFISYHEKQVILLNEQGVIRLEGRNLDNPAAESNMSGKSAIVDALCWVYFGRTIRGIKHDAVVHRKYKKDCSVSVYFRKDDTQYTVKRFRRHSTFHNRVLLFSGDRNLFSGDRNLSYRHDSETQQKIEEILECDFTSFVNSVVFGGVRPFASLSDSEQKKILESFLHFEKVDNALRRTKEKINVTEGRIQETEGRITKQGRDSLSIRAKAANSLYNSRLLAASRRSAKKRIAVLHKRISEESSSSGKTKEIDIGNRISRATKRRAKAHLSLGLAQGQLESARQDLHKLKSAAIRLTNLGVRCSYCGSKVTPENKERYLQRLLRDQSLAKARIREAKALVVERRKEVSYREAKLEKLHTLAQEARLRAQRREELGERVSDLKQEIVKLSDSSLPDIDKEILQYSRSVASLLHLEKEKARLLLKQEDLEFWKEGFGNKGIKALIVREAIPAMNEKLKEFSSKIFQEDVELKFLPAKETKTGEDRELFHIQYSNRRGSASYLGESAGGRKRVDLCVLLVLSWMSRVCNILLIDELLDGLDEIGRERVLEILSSWKGTVLVISHRRDIRSNIGKRWVVTKKNGNSTLQIRE